MQENRVLFVTVAPIPQVRLIPWPVSKVLIDEEIFEEIGAGDTNGFYDFLRSPQGQIIGIRFAPFVEHADICDSVHPGPGLRATGESQSASIELFWGAAQPYDQSLSADQFMDYNYIFRSASGNYGVTFGFCHLTEVEIANLLSGVESHA